MRNITTASEEQAKGIQEITKAIRVIDNTNHENVGLVNQLEKVAGSMGEESEKLGAVVIDIEKKLSA